MPPVEKSEDEAELAPAQSTIAKAVSRRHGVRVERRAARVPRWNRHGQLLGESRSVIGSPGDAACCVEFRGFMA